MIRLVLDASVLVSAAIVPEGSPAKLLQAALEGEVDLIVRSLLIGELRGVLARPKFRSYLSEEQATRFVLLIERVAIEHPDEPEPPPVVRDRADDYLIALARAAGAHAIVSGDKDLTELQGVLPPVITPREALDRIERGRQL